MGFQLQHSGGFSVRRPKPSQGFSGHLRLSSFLGPRKRVGSSDGIVRVPWSSNVRTCGLSQAPSPKSSRSHGTSSMKKGACTPIQQNSFCNTAVPRQYPEFGTAKEPKSICNTPVPRKNIYIYIYISSVNGSQRGGQNMGPS